MSELWEEVRKGLSQTLGADDFRNWIDKAKLITVDGGQALIEVPTRFTGEWIIQTYGDTILRVMRNLESDIVRLNYVVRAGKPPAPGLQSTPGEEVAEMDLPGANLVSRFTFEQFVVGKPNAAAYAAAQGAVEDVQANFSPLVLHGGVGLGKTHLMNAVGWAIRESDPGAKVVFLSAEQFMYLFVRALRQRNVLEFKEMFRSVDVLMVDDIQFVAGKDSTQEEFFHTFNELAKQSKRIVLSADRSPGRIEGLEERIRSRLQSGLPVELHPADYELRLGILQQKAEFLSDSNPELRIAPGVLEFIAHRISSNARVLEGALNRLVAAQSFAKSDITMEFTLDVLADLLRESDRKVQIDEIIRCVASQYNVKPTDLVGNRRTRDIARPRQMAIFLAKSLTTKSLPEIGRHFNRDHTTVLHSIRRIEKLTSHDSQLSDDLEVLRRKIEA
ncbi:MAG: chromosomal replication initiator protein DnaA [Rhodobacteraceae bacterium]|nr:chromosomal replication initiator protein DnaA [Paracoccaceae bacterium]